MGRYCNDGYNGVSNYRNAGVIASISFPYPWEGIAIKPKLQPETAAEKLLVCANALGYEAEIVSDAGQEPWVRIHPKGSEQQKFEVKGGNEHYRKLERLYESWKHSDIRGGWIRANWRIHVDAEHNDLTQALINLVCAVMAKWKPKKDE